MNLLKSSYMGLFLSIFYGLKDRLRPVETGFCRSSQISEGDGPKTGPQLRSSSVLRGSCSLSAENLNPNMATPHVMPTNVRTKADVVQ